MLLQSNGKLINNTCWKGFPYARLIMRYIMLRHHDAPAAGERAEARRRQQTRRTVQEDHAVMNINFCACDPLTHTSPWSEYRWSRAYNVIHNWCYGVAYIKCRVHCPLCMKIMYWRHEFMTWIDAGLLLKFGPVYVMRLSPPILLTLR